MTLPGQLPGCSRAAVTLTGQGFTTTIKGTAGNESSVATAAPPNKPIESALIVPTSAPVASFTGGNLLTGNCTTVEFASFSLAIGGYVEYPWLGCSEHNRGCCPFDPDIGGPLSLCPQDYTTTANACCPS